MSEKIVHLNEEVIKGQLKELVRGSVEETLNGLLEAEAEFMLMRREYLTITGRRRGKDDVLAYHLRQSFKPGEITPEKANRISCELAKRFTHGNHAFIVATHTNTSCVQHVLCKGRF